MLEPRGNSECTRCLDAILPEEFEQFLRNDYICPKCAEAEDAEYVAEVEG